MAKRKPRAIDLFSGCGGTSLGIKNAGFRVIAAVENDPLAVATYRKNLRDVQVWARDIRRLAVKEVMAYHKLGRGGLDLLAGCPPCQAFSALPRLNGRRRVRDKKSKDLVFQYLRFVRKLLPKVVLIENVPRLIKDYRFNQVRKALRHLGYVGKPIVLDAAHFGVPQRRRRMVFIASRVGPIQYAAPAAKSKSLTVKDTIGRLPRPAKSRDALHKLPEDRCDRVKALIAAIPKNGGSRTALGVKQQLRCHEECDGFNDVYGRMAWGKVAPTITGGCVNPSKGRFLHPTQNRAMTLREAALLQTFPLRYWFSLERGKFAAAQMIGNAFPPILARKHAFCIIKRLRAHANEKGTR